MCEASQTPSPHLVGHDVSSDFNEEGVQLSLVPFFKHLQWGGGERGRKRDKLEMRKEERDRGKHRKDVRTSRDVLRQTAIFTYL